MTHEGFSRRGFLTRAAGAAVGLLGGSIVGGFSTRAWARPLHHLRAGGRPVIGQPRSVVPIGLDEAMKRERRAARRPEFQSLVRELTSEGYKRSGEPSGVDGVAGYMTEGGHAVSLGFAKDGDEPSIFVDIRWWDQRREPWPCDDVMPDVYSREVLQGPPGTPPSVVRFRYVDEEGRLATRDETVAAASTQVPCQTTIHTHPPGACPPSCDGSGPALCLHYGYYANVCSYPPPDCRACSPCYLCVPFTCGASCALICQAVCNTFTEQYCCDWTESVCCPPDPDNLLRVPECL